MPIYEYECKKCEKIYEVEIKMSEVTPTRECEKCHSMMEKKISGLGGISFKGSGFYVNDYGKGK